jgi:hypothetical protein
MREGGSPFPGCGICTSTSLVLRFVRIVRRRRGSKPSAIGHTAFRRQWRNRRARQSGNLSVLLEAWTAIRIVLSAGPRMIVTGEKLGSGKPVVPGAPSQINTPDDIRRSLELLKAEGAGLVKVCS